MRRCGSHEDNAHAVKGWTCPECGRQFGRRNQSHECAPALSLDEYFATSHHRERPIFEAVVDHLESSSRPNTRSAVSTSSSTSGSAIGVDRAPARSGVSTIPLPSIAR